MISEAVEGTVREGTIELGTPPSVLCAFITFFIKPYQLLNGPTPLGEKAGFIYDSICVVFAMCAYLGIPQMKATAPDVSVVLTTYIDIWRRLTK